jgi:hypothetical protein
LLKQGCCCTDLTRLKKRRKKSSNEAELDGEGDDTAAEEAAEAALGPLGRYVSYSPKMAYVLALVRGCRARGEKVSAADVDCLSSSQWMDVRMPTARSLPPRDLLSTAMNCMQFRN